MYVAFMHRDIKHVMSGGRSCAVCEVAMAALGWSSWHRYRSSAHRHVAAMHQLYRRSCREG